MLVDYPYWHFGFGWYSGQQTLSIWKCCSPCLNCCFALLAPNANGFRTSYYWSCCFVFRTVNLVESYHCCGADLVPSPACPCLTLLLWVATQIVLACSSAQEFVPLASLSFMHLSDAVAQSSVTRSELHLSDFVQLSAPSWLTATQSLNPELTWQGLISHWSSTLTSSLFLVVLLSNKGLGLSSDFVPN